MRPHEIDHASRARHYIDVTNSEILAGKEQYQTYVGSPNVDSQHVHDIGVLLRQPIEQIVELKLDRLDTTEWPKEQFVEFGRWLKRVVSPPAQSERVLNGKVLRNAMYLGIGPGASGYRKHFGTRHTYSNFYTEVGGGGFKINGQFDDWDITEFVEYLKRVGGEVPPKAFAAHIAQLSKKDARKPSYDYMTDRFAAIGGFRKLTELAGYAVVKLWEREDYIDWGVNFMLANGGLIPTAVMMDYMSQRYRGPASSTIISKFDKVGAFQREIISYYETRANEIESDRAQKGRQIDRGLRRGEVPLELFEGIHGRGEITALGSSSIGQQYITRFAKFTVLQLTVPSMEYPTRVAISKDDKGNFIRSIRKAHDKPAATIEHIALVAGYFDDIWPPSYMDALRLGDNFEDFCKQRYGNKHLTRPHLRARIPLAHSL